MKKLPSSNKVYVGQSKIPNAGRGVYAKRNIKKDEIIESCPIIEIPEHDMPNLRENILITYFFYYGKKKEKSAIALGFGSIYDHSYKPNAKYDIKDTDGLINFIALKNIKKDDEITVNYNPGNSNKNPLWFEDRPNQ